MSWGALHWALEQDINDGIAKFLLVILAERASPETLDLYRTVPNLARDTSQSERTIQRKLLWLEQEGFIRRLEDFDPGTGRQRANGFVVLAPDSVKRGKGDDARPAKPRPSRPRRGDTQSPSPSDNEGCQPVTPGVTDSHREGDTCVTGEGDSGVTPNTNQYDSNHSESKDSAPSNGAGTRDFRKDLFERGVRTVRDPTGRPELRCRALIGSWLKGVDDDAVTVLRAIDEAIGAEAIEPVAWIEARLKHRPPATTPAPPRAVSADVADRRSAEAQRMVERGEWPSGGSVFVLAESAEGAAWERYFERFGRRARWTTCGTKGLGWHMPTAVPPRVQASAE